MTREEKEQTGKYVLQMARLLEDGCHQQEMLLNAVHIIDEALDQEPCEELDFVQPHKKMSVNLEVCKMREATQEEREGVERYIDSISEPCEDAESVRQELLDRGDEMVSFRQLVERFDEVEDEYQGVPWNLRQIYNNFNILIGEKRLSDCISRQDAVNACRNGWGYDDETIEHIVGNILGLPPVTPAEKVGRWEYVQYDGNPNIGNWHCSECRAIVNYEPTYNWEKKPYHKFCPMCGAKMQEVEE